MTPETTSETTPGSSPETLGPSPVAPGTQGLCPCVLGSSRDGPGVSGEDPGVVSEASRESSRGPRKLEIRYHVSPREYPDRDLLGGSRSSAVAPFPLRIHVTTENIFDFPYCPGDI